MWGGGFVLRRIFFCKSKFNTFFKRKLVNEIEAGASSWIFSLRTSRDYEFTPDLHLPSGRAFKEKLCSNQDCNKNVNTVSELKVDGANMYITYCIFTMTSHASTPPFCTLSLSSGSAARPLSCALLTQ